MFRFVVRYFQAVLVLLFVLILCNWIAGPKNMLFWFAVVSVMLFTFTVAGMIVRRSR